MRLPDPQRHVLQNIKDGRAADAGIYGKSASGGFGATLRACRIHGLIAHTGEFWATWYLTTKGKDALTDGKYAPVKKR